MVQREQEIVTEQFCDLENVYNIMPGGKFGSKDKNGLTFKDRKHSDETKAKISKNRRGLTVSVETKQKLKENNFAKRNPTAQREHAQKAGQSARNIDDQKRKEINKKISIALKSLNSNKVHSNKGLIRQKVQCPYCCKQGALNTMKRFHFDNCKFQNAPIAQR